MTRRVDGLQKRARRASRRTARAVPARRVSASEVRDGFSDAINRVVYGHERIVLERHGKPVVALVPVADLKLLEELEDRLDLEAAREALAEAEAKGTRPWEKIKAALGR